MQLVIYCRALAAVRRDRDPLPVDPYDDGALRYTVNRSVDSEADVTPRNDLWNRGDQGWQSLLGAGDDNAYENERTNPQQGNLPMLSENLGHDQLLVVQAAAKGKLYHGVPVGRAADSTDGGKP